MEALTTSTFQIPSSIYSSSPSRTSSSTPTVTAAASLFPHTRTSSNIPTRLRSFYRGSNELLAGSSLANHHQQHRSRPRHAVIVVRNSAAGGYAAALAEIGRSQNVLDGINSDMENLRRFLQDPQINDFLVNPTVIDSHKKSVLETLAKEAGFVPYTLNLLNLVVDRKRTNILKEIAKEFEELYNQMTETEVAIVTSAVKVNTAQLAQIAKKVQTMSGAKNVRMKNVIDPSLIAGFIVRYGKDGSRLIDMSVKGQLDRIAQEIKLTEEVGVFSV